MQFDAQCVAAKGPAAEFHRGRKERELLFCFDDIVKHAADQTEIDELCYLKATLQCSAV